MRSIIEDLYYGKVIPYEQFTNYTRDYTRVNNKISSEMKEYQNKLPKSEYDRLEELFKLYTESSIMENGQSFIHWFRLAAAIMAEVFTAQTKLSYD